MRSAKVAPDAASWEKNPAAADFIAYANLWRSHFEESAPVLKSLAAQYPAEAEIAHAASSVYRSLAYFEPADTAVAAKIEDNFLQANPGDTETMARIGDIYADRELFAQAAPYWERIPQVAPGQSSGYLEAATIYWDYFDFDNALRLLGKGRDALANPSLYAYEAGAIYENQRDYPQAIDEYVKGALRRSGLVGGTRVCFSWRGDPSSAISSIRAQRRSLRLAESCNGSSQPASESVWRRRTASRSWSHSWIRSRTARLPSSRRKKSRPSRNRKSLETVRQHAIEKQAALTTDPVTRLQLRYALIQLVRRAQRFCLRAEECRSALSRESDDSRRGPLDRRFLLAHEDAAASDFCSAAGLERRVSGSERAVHLRSRAEVNRGETIPAGARSA